LLNKKVVLKMISKNCLRFLLLSASLTLLPACSWFADDEEMEDARILAPLEVPPDLVKPAGDPRLARPDLPATSSAPASASAQAADCRCEQPPSIGERVLPAGKGVQRMREGSRRWLVVEAEPEQAWPLVRKFLAMRGYRVQRDEPAIGLLETDWKAQYADENGAEEQTGGQSNWRERLRLRIEPAEQAGRTAIFLTQRNSQRGEDGNWQLRPADTDRAVEMLNRLARFLADKDVSDAVPLKGLQASIEVDADEHTVIIAKADFDTVWRRTSLALDALGFTIEDHNRANRIFHVYNELPSGYTQEELEADSRKKATVREEYWIHVQPRDESTHISVRNQAGIVDESQVARSLLTLLLGQLR
jgi:outer membrane protein assembly factor BamC